MPYGLDRIAQGRRKRLAEALQIGDSRVNWIPDLDDAMDQADALGFLGIDGATTSNQLDSSPNAHQTRQPLSSP